MRKNYLFLLGLMFLAIHSFYGQTLNQPANWPNGAWTLTGTYDAPSLLADPTISANFSYDDDASGSGSTDILNAESPVIDLTAAAGAGETWITVTFTYNYNLGDIFDVEYYDADAASWVTWEAIPDNSSTTSNYCGSIVAGPFTTSNLFIGGFTPTQLSGFRYRLAYDASSTWGWGFCVSSPTIVSASPPACLDPAGLNVSNVTGSSADLNWANVGSDAYNVEWGAPGFTPGTATEIGSASGVLGLTTNASGLTPTTTYEFYVQSDCGVDGLSAWVGPFSFTTPCASLSVPWTENFDALGAVGTDAYPPCWYEESGGWRTANDASSGNDAPVYSSPNMLQNAWSATNEFMWTPGFDLTSGTAYEFSFWWAGDNYPDWAADIFVNSSQTSVGATQIGTPIVEGTTTTDMTWRRKTVIYTPGSTGTYYFAIRVNEPTGNPWYISFDDFALNLAPTCLPVATISTSNVTASSADVTWTENTTPNSWNIEWGTPGFTPGTGAEIGAANTMSLTYNIGSLTDNTTYDVYVQADCGGGDLSTWTLVSFSTLCGAFPAEGFCESFDSGSTTENCWTVLNVNADGDQWDLDYTQNPFAGDQVAIMYTDFNSGANDDWLITPQLTLVGTEKLKFNFRAQSSGEPDDFEVLLSTTGTNPADFTNTLMAVNTYGNTTYMDTVVDLSAYSGNVFIAFHVPSSVQDGWRLYIDEVCISSCFPEDAPNSGTGSVLTVCQNEPVDLTTGLTGPYDNDGVWYNPSMIPMASGNTTSESLGGQYNYRYITSATGCDNDTAIVTLDVSFSCNYLGLEDLNSLKFKVFPNPTSDVLNIEMDGANSSAITIQVVELAGKVLTTQNYTSGELLTVDIATLSTGTYMLLVSDGLAERTVRIVKQ